MLSQLVSVFTATRWRCLTGEIPEAFWKGLKARFVSSFHLKTAFANRSQGNKYVLQSPMLPRFGCFSDEYGGHTKASSSFWTPAVLVRSDKQRSWSCWSLLSVRVWWGRCLESVYAKSDDVDQVHDANVRRNQCRTSCASTRLKVLEAFFKPNGITRNWYVAPLSLKEAWVCVAVESHDA